MADSTVAVMMDFFGYLSAVLAAIAVVMLISFAIDVRALDHDRCLKDATNGMEIKRCR